jgi:hypothetical protein
MMHRSMNGGGKDCMKTVLAGVLLLISAMAGGGSVAHAEEVSPALEERPSVLVSILAANRCLKQIRNGIGSHAQADAPATDLSCDIPVNLAEADLDALFRTVVAQSKMSDDMKSLGQRYSSSLAKTLTNFHGADCMIKLRVQRAALLAARAAESTEMQLDAQPAECDVLTGSKTTQKLKFAFTPRVKWVKGCVNEFWLNMGGIDAGCKVCYFDRLYLATNLVAMWANRIGPNARDLLNRQLGGDCW